MKKKWLIVLTALLMALTMCFGFAACGDDPQGENPGGENPGGENPGGENPGGTTQKTDSEIAKEAISTIKVMYSSSAVETAQAFDVLGQTKVDDKLYPVVWTATTAMADVNISDYVKIGTMNESTKLVTIGISRATVDLEYTLKASVTVGSATESAEFAHKIPKKSSEDSVTASLDFSDLANRAKIDTENNEQVWKQNGVTLTNTVNVADYSNPIRLYKNTPVSIEMENARIIHIDFHSAQGYSDSPYPDYLKQSLEASDLPIKGEITVSDDGLKISVDFETPLEVVTFKATAGQCRLTSIDVEAIERDPNEHVHNWTYEHVANTWTHTATCTAEGCDIKTKTENCTPKLNVCACGYTYSAKEIVDALFALDTGKSLPGTYSLTGVITKVTEVDTGTYKNCTFDMTVEGQTVTVYRAKGSHYSEVEVGGTATVNGELLDYNGTKEFTQGASVVAFTPGVDERTPQEKVDAALQALSETFTVTKTGETDLPASTVRDVTFAWATEDKTYTIANNKINVTALPTADVTITATVTATCGSEAVTNNTKTVTITIKAQSTADEGFKPITAPAAGSDYYLAMDINGTWYYSTGSMSSHFLGTTTDISKAVKVTVAASGSGWTLVTNGKYIEIEVGDYNNIVLNDAQTDGKVWMWDAQHAVFTMTVGSDSFFMGTYGTYTTFNAAYVSYLDQANEYIGKIGTYTGSVEPGPGGDEATLPEGDAKLDFSSITEHGSEIAAGDATEYFKGFTTSADLTAAEVTAKVYKGNGTGGGDYENAGGMIKMGTSKLGATITLKFAKNVTKVVILAQGWPNKSDTITVNGEVAQTMSGSEKALYVFELTTPAQEIKITSNLRAFIFGLVVNFGSGTVEPEPEENYGTLEDPLTVAEAIELATSQISGNGYLGGTTSPVEVYVQGYVIAVGGWDSSHNDWTKVYIADTKDAVSSDKAKAIQVYRLELDGTFLKTTDDLVVGAKITLFGCLQSYNGTTEVSHNPSTNENCKAVAYELPAHVHQWTYTYTSGLKHTKVCNAAGCDLNKEPQTEACSPVANVCACGHTATQEEIIAAINALASGETLPGTYQLTGTVDSRGLVKTGTSGDWQFYIEVGDLTLMVYYASHDVVTADTLTEGDIVTVLGVLTNYNGTKEFNSGAKIVSWTTKSDDEKLQAIADKLKIYYSTTEAVSDDAAILRTSNELRYPMPTNGLFEGATLTWAFVEDGTDEWFTTRTGSGFLVSYSGSYTILTLKKATDVEKVFTLRATLELDGKTKTKDFKITIPVMSDEEKVDADVKGLSLGFYLYLWEIGQSYDLPATGTAGSAITWAFKETAPDYVAIEGGKFVLKSHPEEQKTVVIVATITSGEVTKTKEFSFTVRTEDIFVPMEQPACGYYYLTTQSLSVGERRWLSSGTLDKNGYLTSSKEASEALKVLLIPVPNETGKWYIKINGKYLSCTYNQWDRLALNTAGTDDSTKWSWDAERHTFVSTYKNEQYVIAANSAMVQPKKLSTVNENTEYGRFGTKKGETLEAPKLATALEFYDATGKKIDANTTIKIKAEANWSTVLYYKVTPQDALSTVLTPSSADSTKATARYGSALLGVYIITGSEAKAGDKTTVTFTVLDTTVSVTLNVEVVAAEGFADVKGEKATDPMTIEELEAYVTTLDGVIEGASAQVGSNRYFYVKGKLTVEGTSGNSRTCYLGENKEISLGTLSASSLKDAAKEMGIALADLNGVEVVVSGRWYLVKGTDDAKTLTGASVSIHNANLSANQKLALAQAALTVDFSAFKAVDATLDLTAAAENAFGVSVAWAVTAPESWQTYVSLTDGTLKIVKLPDDATTFTLKATLTLEGGTDVTKEFAFFLVPAADLEFDMSKNTGNNTSAQSASAVRSFLGTACGNNAEFTDVTTATQVFRSNSSGGPIQTPGCMKLGANGKDAELVLKFGKKVTKVIIVWASWSADEGKLTVNEIGKNEFQASFGVETFTLTEASDTLTIQSTGRVIITSISVYFEEDAPAAPEAVAAILPGKEF